MGIPLALGVGSAAGVVEGVLIVALATPERYRRTDERDRPARRRGWAFIWAFVACLGIAVSWRNSPLLMAILLAWVAPVSTWAPAVLGAVRTLPSTWLRGRRRRLRIPITSLVI